MFGNCFLKVCIVGLLLAWPAAALDAGTIEWVTVGDPGNTGEVQTQGTFGAVGYSYLIGKYEVTAGQYTEFLSAIAATDDDGLYNGSMWSSRYGCKIQQDGSSGGFTYSVAADYADRPVNYVNFYDSLRFCNWLHNDQPTGGQTAATTEDGAYTFTAKELVGERNSGAMVFLPSEDEWYKAAYYDPVGLSYSLYPTGTGATPGQDMSEGTNQGNNVNYKMDGGTYPLNSPHYTTLVGEFELSDSPYGTFDQGGNVWEWNEALIDSSRGVRGCSSVSGYGSYWLRASSRNSSAPATESDSIGFRVASIPEPGSITLLLSGAVVLLIWRRRRK